MTPRVLMDTGPLVAALHPRDRWHRWAAEQLGLLRAPFGAPEAVIAEAAYLLRGAAGGPDRLLQLFEQGAGVALSLSAELGAVRALCRTYRSVPMDFADACLVRLSELHPRIPVLTLDSDFLVYRRNRTQKLPLIIPRGV